MSFSYGSIKISYIIQIMIIENSEVIEYLLCFLGPVINNPSNKNWLFPGQI
jgi:hypothetical protein